MQVIDDECSLVNAAIAGDQQALERVLLGHYPRLLRRVGERLPANAVAQLDAEDVLQEALVDVFRAIGSFQPSGEGAFAAWLNAIVEHRLQDNLRRMRRKKRGGEHKQVARPEGATSSFVNLAALISDSAPTPSGRVAQGEAIRAIQVGLAGLPDDQRAVIVHRYIEQQSLESTAAAMRRTPGAVRGLLHRAKSSLREAMGRSTRWFGRY